MGGKLEIATLQQPALDGFRKATSAGVNVQTAAVALRAEDRAQLKSLAQAAGLDAAVMGTFEKLRAALMQVRDERQFQVLMDAILQGTSEDFSDVQAVLKKMNVTIPDNELQAILPRLRGIDEANRNQVLHSGVAIRRHQQILEGMMDRLRKYSEDLVVPFRGRVTVEQGLEEMAPVVQKSEEMFREIGETMRGIRSAALSSTDTAASKRATSKLLRALDGINDQGQVTVLSSVEKLQHISVADRRSILKRLSGLGSAIGESAENNLKRLSEACSTSRGRLWAAFGCAVVLGAVATAGTMAAWDGLTKGPRRTRSPPICPGQPPTPRG